MGGEGTRVGGGDEGSYILSSRVYLAKDDWNCRGDDRLARERYICTSKSDS